MKTLSILIGLILILTLSAAAQINPNALPPQETIDDDPDVMPPAYLITVICTDGPVDTCPNPPEFDVVAYTVVNGTTYRREGRTDVNGFIKLDMRGLPSRHPTTGQILNYTVLAGPCGIVVIPYPNGYVPVEVRTDSTPC